MTIVVEDGTGILVADSYISLEAALVFLASTTYLTNFSALDDETKEKFLVAATAWLDNKYRWYGNAKVNTQTLGWPRTKNYDSLGRVIVAGTIPLELKRATALIAGIIQSNAETIETVGANGPIKSWSTDGLSIAFGGAAEGFSHLVGTRYPEVELLLRPIGTLKDTAFLQTDKTTIVK